MNKIKSTLVVGALAASAAGVLLGGANVASATGSPTPWVPGGVNQDPHAVGGLEFFDATGSRITGGAITDQPFAAFVAGLTKTRAVNDTKATIFGYVPQVGQTPDTWSTQEQIGLASTYPNASAPAPVNGTTLPVNTGTATDESLATLAADLPNTSSTTGYVNAYELRMYTSSQGNGVSVNYDYADITINTTTHTWALVYSPDASGTATTSTLGSSSTAVNQGDTVTLTDTISPAANGTVQFKNGGTDIGTPVTVSGGVATTTALISAAGANNITAVFTPADLSGVAGSTSNTVTVNATHVIATTSVALIANPTTGPAFSAVTLTATVTPGIAGQVKFFDAGAQIGLVNETTGTATDVYSGFTQGDHANITASFTPTDTANYSGSVSPAVDFNATAPLGALPDPQPIEADVAPGSLAITTPYTSANPLNLGTLALNAAGTQLSAHAAFGDGTVATYGAGGPDGTGSIQIVDTRSGNANWTASALSSDLIDSSSDSISAQNVGLTGLTAVPVAGNAQTSANLTLTGNPAADPAVAPGAAGSLGLGGSTPHAFASTIAGGDGTIGITGTLTLNAPTSTKAGHYTGTITFTVV